MGTSTHRAPRRALILLAAVLGLGLVSLAQGLASGRLSVRGMVLTDDVNASWYGGVCTQTAPAPQPGLVGSVLAPSVLDAAALDLTISNAFPGLVVECRVDLANTGLLPVRLLGVAVENTTSGAVVSGLLGGPDNTVLVPCAGAPAWGSAPEPANCRTSQGMRIRVTDAALPNTRYQFTVRLCVAQESVTATPEQCFAGIPAPDPNAALPADETGFAPPPAQPSPVAPVLPSPAAPPSADAPQPTAAPGSGGTQPAATPAAGSGGAVPIGGTAATPAPTIEVLPLTPPPATATPPPPTAAAAPATPGPVIQVLPLTPAAAPAAAIAPAPPPRLPNTGAGSVATASDIGLDVLVALLGLTAAACTSIRLWTRRAGTKRRD